MDILTMLKSIFSIDALIYLAMVMFFTYLVNKLERRLRNSER